MKNILVLSALLLSSITHAALPPEKIMDQLQKILSKEGALLMPPNGVKYGANELSVGFERIDIDNEDEINGESSAIVMKEIRALAKDSGGLALEFEGDFLVQTRKDAEIFFMNQLVSKDVKKAVAGLLKDRPIYSKFYRVSAYDVASEVIGAEVIVLVFEKAVLIIRMSYVHA